MSARQASGKSKLAHWYLKFKYLQLLYILFFFRIHRRKTKEAIASTASTEGTISSIVASLSDLSQILANKPHMSDVEVELRLGKKFVRLALRRALILLLRFRNSN